MTPLSHDQYADVMGHIKNKSLHRVSPSLSMIMCKKKNKSVVLPETLSSNMFNILYCIYVICV